jgi:hypothetical protein
MSETLGRGALTDDRRIERISKYAAENEAQRVPIAAVSARAAVTRETKMALTSLSNDITGKSMSNNSYALQNQLLTDLKNKLEDLQNNLQTNYNNFENDAIALGHGMMRETMEGYVNNELQITSRLIKELVNHIKASDVAKINKEIALVELHL